MTVLQDNSRMSSPICKCSSSDFNNSYPMNIIVKETSGWEFKLNLEIMCLMPS